VVTTHSAAAWTATATSGADSHADAETNDQNNRQAGHCNQGWVTENEFAGAIRRAAGRAKIGSSARRGRISAAISAAHEY
jgi:hypothetical protein